MKGLCHSFFEPASMRPFDLTVLAMVREWPIRSAITILVPLLFVVFQLANSFYHGVSLVYAGAIATPFVGMTVLTVQHQRAEFRASRCGTGE